MAIYVGIRKICEDSQFATYEFGPDEQHVGTLRIAKDTGAVEILSEVPGDEPPKFSPRAKRKLATHFHRREFPDRTCWAS